MALESDISQFQANALFGVFDVEALRLIAFSSDTRTLRAGDVLFRLGDVSDGGYLILSGEIEISDGIASQNHGAGALVGELALFTETTRPATATATQPTMLRRIPRHLMRRVLTEYPATALRVRDRFAASLSGAAVSLREIVGRLPDEESVDRKS